MRYESIKEIEDPNTLPEGIIREKNERIKRTLDLVNSMALELASAGSDVDIYKMMTDKIKEITGAFAVNISTYDEAHEELKQRAISSGSTVLEKIESIIGTRFNNQTYKVDPEIKESMMKEVIAISDDLHEASLYSIPKIPSRIIMRTFSLKRFVGISIVHKDILYGTIFIIMGKDSPPIDYEILGVIKAVASQMFYRRSVEDDLREYETRYTELFMNIKDSVVLSSREGRIIDHNPQFLKLIEATEKDIKHLKVQELYEDTSRRKQFIEEIEEKGSVVDYPIKIKTMKGDVRNCVFTSTLKKNPDGSILGYQGILRDVTESERMKKELENEKSRAELYLDLLGHDIGNLHQGIENALSLLQVKKDDPESSRIIMGCANDLFSKSKNLTTQIKLLARVRSVEPDLHSIRIDAIMKEEISKMRYVYSNRDMDIKLDDNGDETNVMADQMVGEIFFNIIHNAIKAQDEEATWIRIKISKEDQGRWVRIGIEDRAGGLPNDIRSFLVSDKEGSVRKHAGLGLSIVKELIVRYNGRIDVTDITDDGTRIGSLFNVYLSIG